MQNSIMSLVIRKNWLAVVFFISFLAFDQAFAQQPAGRQQISEQEMKAIAQEYAFLKSQVQDFQKFIQTERQQHTQFVEGLFEKTIWALGLVVVAFGLILRFWGASTFKNIEKEIETRINRLFEQHALRVIDEKNESLRISVEQLRELIDRESLYKKKRILFIAQEGDFARLNENELAWIKARGIKNLTLSSDAEKALAMVKRDAYDTIVYYYAPSPSEPEAGDPALRHLAQFLSVRNARIPLIVYTYEKGVGNRLYNIDKAEIDKYDYAILANFPLTLVQYLFTVANYFPVL